MVDSLPLIFSEEAVAQCLEHDQLNEKQKQLILGLLASEKGCSGKQAVVRFCKLFLNSDCWVGRICRN